MSFYDHDLRDQRISQRLAQREMCTKRGSHVFRGMAGGPEAGACLDCGEPNPSASKPHVTLVADDYRAVFDPSKQVVMFEKRDRDATGAERWSECATPLSGTRSRSEQWPAHLWALLTKGRAP